MEEALEERIFDDLREEPIPDWLEDVLPGLPLKDGPRAAKEWTHSWERLATHSSQFITGAAAGCPCRFFDVATAKSRPAAYSVNKEATHLRVRLSETVVAGGNEDLVHDLRDIKNIWVCSDSPVARKFHGSVRGAEEADLSCLVLLDVPSGPFALIMRSSEARERFIDGMAVFIAARRLLQDDSVTRCGIPGGVPPPEARVRPVGRSLHSVHLTGPICAWLAKIAAVTLKGLEVTNADAVNHESGC